VLKRTTALAAFAMLMILAACQRPDMDRGTGQLAGLKDELAPGVTAQPAVGAPSGLMASGGPAKPTPVVVRGRERPVGVPGGAGLNADDPADIDLSFEGTDIATVAKAVLGDVLAVPYVLDERVQGTVTLATGQPVSRAQVLGMLEASLRQNGAALVRQGTLFRVVPLEDAPRTAGPPEPAELPGPGHAVSVFAPRHVSVTTLQKLLEPLYQATGALQIDAVRNLLLVSGPADERRSLVDAARAFDQDWMKGRSVGIYPLAQARAQAAVRELDTIFGDHQDGPGAGVVQFMAVERLNAVLVVANGSAMLDEAASWVQRLDQGTYGERTLYVHQLQYGKAKPLARVLSRVFAQAGTTEGAVDTSAPLPPGTRGARLSTAPSVSSSPVRAIAGAARRGDLGTTPADGADPRLEAVFDRAREAESAEPEPSTGANSVRIVADESRNALVILATPEEFRQVQAALQRLDVPPNQVLIEATIAEVTLNNSLRFGVQYFLKGNGFANEDQTSVGLSTSGSRIIPSPELPGFNAILGRVGDPRVVLSALDNMTDVKVVSSPQVVVLDNQEALLKVGDRVPVTTREAQSVLDPEAPIVNTIEFQDTGVILRVIPRINAGGTVSMDIAQEVSAVSETANTGRLTPTITQRRIESSVAVPTGQTVVLGGLISEEGANGKSGVPVLSDIPVLGHLFGTTTTRDRRTELIVFITPRVLHNADEARRITEELMGKLKSMRPSPVKAKKGGA